MFPLPIHIYFEIGAMITAILFHRSLRATVLRWFIPFLIFIVLVELTGRYMAYIMHQPNAWLYNFSVPVEYLFYAIIFYYHYRNRFNRIAALVFITFFSLFVLIQNFFISGIANFNLHFLNIGTFSMVFFSLLYFFEFYNSPEAKHPLKEPMFWITSGVLLFNAGEFSYNLFSKYLVENDFDKTLEIFRNINNRLILILYSTIIISFLCTKATATSRKA
jgi:hypothetical protein